MDSGGEYRGITSITVKPTGSGVRRSLVPLESDEPYPPEPVKKSTKVATQGKTYTGPPTELTAMPYRGNTPSYGSSSSLRLQKDSEVSMASRFRKLPKVLDSTSPTAGDSAEVARLTESQVSKAAVHAAEEGKSSAGGLNLVDLDEAFKATLGDKLADNGGNRGQGSTEGFKERPSGGRRHRQKADESQLQESGRPIYTRRREELNTVQEGHASRPPMMMNWSTRTLGDIHKETCGRLEHIRDCMRTLGGSEVAELEASLTGLLRDMRGSCREVEERFRDVVEVAINAREDARAALMEGPMERARLKKLEKDLEGGYERRLEEVNKAWLKEKDKIESLTKRLQGRLAELGGPEGSMETAGGKLAKENLALKQEVARMRTLHRHANEMHVESQLEAALMLEMLDERKRDLAGSKEMAEQMEETARMTREELEATRGSCRRLTKTLDLIDAHVLQKSLGADLGIRPLLLRRGGVRISTDAQGRLGEATKAEWRGDRVQGPTESRSLTHECFTKRYSDSFGFRAVPSDGLPRPLTAGKAGSSHLTALSGSLDGPGSEGICRVLAVFRQRINEHRSNSIRALPESLPWMMRKPSITEVFGRPPSAGEVGMSLTQTLSLCHNLMDAWAVDALATVGDFSQKTVGFPEFTYQFVTSERLEDYSLADETSFVEYLLEFDVAVAEWQLVMSSCRATGEWERLLVR
ncbi:hypothetical protein FOL47_001801 [Perkinsus chesapeaki]|uniref:Uncharacterized protein n=1 Tax=Perkinsus chesapeaki TaxID=330153 RepID=A0A7J6MHE3_PERCH|nr:hypothetical protein FOL47_001801 [Perkinsus chesapeaki]